MTFLRPDGLVNQASGVWWHNARSDSLMKAYCTCTEIARLYEQGTTVRQVPGASQKQRCGNRKRVCMCLVCPGVREELTTCIKQIKKLGKDKMQTNAVCLHVCLLRVFWNEGRPHSLQEFCSECSQSTRYKRHTGHVFALCVSSRVMPRSESYKFRQGSASGIVRTCARVSASRTCRYKKSWRLAEITR